MSRHASDDEVPRLYLVGARQLFMSDATWLEALQRTATAVRSVASHGVALQVRIEDAVSDTNALATEALRRIRSADPLRTIPVYLNAANASAAELGFDGQHDPERRIPTHAAATDLRRAASIHSPAALRRASAAGAQFVVYGAIWAPSWKATDVAGCDALREITDAARVPVLAIGGVTPDRVADCLAAGAAGVAVASGVVAATDPQRRLMRYLRALDVASSEPS